MKVAPIFLLALAASNVHANSLTVTVGAGRTDVKSKVSVDGENRSNTNKLQTAHLGLFVPSTENFGFGAELGLGDSIGSGNYTSRSFKLMPNYKVLDAGAWIFAGAGYYDISETSSVNHGVTTGILGAAFRPKTGFDRLSLDFSLFYEKSISSEDFKIDDVSLSNYKLENIGTSFGLTYSL